MQIVFIGKLLTDSALPKKELNATVPLEAVKKIYGIIPGPSFRVFIEDNRWSSVFAAAEQPHI